MLKQEPVTTEIISNNNESASIKDAASKSLCASEPDQSMKVTSSLQTPVTRNSEISQHEGLVSNSVKLMANKPKTQVSSWFSLHMLILRTPSFSPSS